MSRQKEVYEDGADAVQFLRDVIANHSGRGAYNVIMAKFNSALQRKILELTSELDKCPELAFMNIQTRVYMLVNGLGADDFPRCCTCGNVIQQNVASIHRGFIYDACSVKCAANRSGRTKQIRDTKKKRYGDPNYNNPGQISSTLKNLPPEQRKAISDSIKMTRLAHEADDPEFQSKITAKCKRTKLERHGDENFNNHEQISSTKQRKKREYPACYEVQVLKGKQTRLERYGDENFNNRDKDKRTKLERHGDENFNNRPKSVETCIARYGVTNPAKASSVKEKTRKTCLETYGAACFLASEQHKQHSKQVCLQKYGVESPMHSDSIRAKGIETKNRNWYKKIISSNDEVTLLASEDEFAHKTELTEFRWHCSRCGEDFTAKPSFEWRRSGAHWARCMICYPLNSSSSLKQRQVYEFIASACPGDAVLMNDRTQISPYEIDVLNMTKRIGIEFDGLYWHSELAGSRRSLQFKTELCRKAGITLVHVLEDEWDMRREQCKAQLKLVLGVHDPMPREFSVECISRKDAQKFLDMNCYDLFARASSSNFAAVDSRGKLLASAGMSVSGGTASLHNLCCAMDCICPDVLHALCQHVLLNAASGMEVHVKTDARWPWHSASWLRLVSTSSPRKWTISTSTWRRTGVHHAHDICNESCTFISDCGQQAFQLVN